MNEILTVTPEELGHVLSNIKRATPIGLSSLTDARAKVTNNPYSPLLKMSRIQAFCGTVFEDAVRRREIKEGAIIPSFEANAHLWAEYVSPALRRHSRTGDLYLAVQVLREPESTYLYKRGGYLTPISKEQIAPFLPPNRTKQEAARQRVEIPIKWRMYRLDSLIRAAFNGRIYRVRHRLQS